MSDPVVPTVKQTNKITIMTVLALSGEVGSATI
jgi:hypothetical protein